MTNYETAISKHNDALKTFQAVRDAYRARIVGDAEFLVAKAAYNVATNKYDAAYAVEAN